jgi:hypothetical protein
VSRASDVLAAYHLTMAEGEQQNRYERAVRLILSAREAGQMSDDVAARAITAVRYAQAAGRDCPSDAELGIK